VRDTGLIMARLLFFIVVVSTLYYVLHLFIKGFSLRKKVNRRDEPEELIQDPHCQTYIPKGSAMKKRIAGKDYYFCSPECLRKYLEKS
jgi:YHS domain-containing protein